jgi:hypothetical protein
MNTDAQAVNAAADALFAAAVAYRTAWAQHAKDPQGFEAAEVTLKAALSKSEELRGAFETALDAADIEVLDGMLDQVLQTASSASAAVDDALAIVGASNSRIARLEESGRR